MLFKGLRLYRYDVSDLKCKLLSFDLRSAKPLSDMDLGLGGG